GDLQDLLRTPAGTLRGGWKLLPAAWVSRLQGVSTTQGIWLVPGLLMATALVKGMAQTGQLYLLGRSSQRLLHRLRTEAFEALLRQSPAFFVRRAHGDLLSRMSHDAGAVEQAFYNGAGPLLRDSLTLVVLLAFCFASDARLALLTFITVPLAVVPLARFTRWLKQVSRVSQAALGTINSVAHESLAGLPVVQAYGAERRQAERLRQASLHYLRQMQRSHLIRAARTPTMEILGTAALAGLVALLGYQVAQRGADSAHYISFFAAIVMMYDPLKKLGAVGDYLATGSTAAERLLEIVALQPSIVDRRGAAELPPFKQAVEFVEVSFAYDARPVLRKVSLTLRAGEVVALVGPSGVGKSTMAQLLPRFYDVGSGAIRLDGLDIRDVTCESLRRQMSLVAQDTFLFDASVAANIAFGRPDASMQDIRQAAQAACADEFIGRLPQGYDSRVGERGIVLSGGQRQRLAIARALLCNRPLLILDEATSHLDIDSERLVQRGVQALLQGRTALVIAHRLSTVRHATRIAVLKDGAIVEQGPHDVLLAQGGEYARLYELQFAGLSRSLRPPNRAAVAAP
ncbi:MAG: ABC transporter ATP-binding protein, partial [Deltaproteobacteria bacterium]